MTDVTPSSQVDAEARQRVALASLREVEYDRAGGKLDDEDYRRLRTQLEREALTAIAAADVAFGRVAPEAEATPVTTVDPPVRSGEIAHACGFVNPAGSRFCAGCGRKLT